MPRETDDSGRGDDSRSVRLQRYLARAGVASRRHAEELVAEGRVRVNGELVERQGVKVIPGTDTVEVDGQLIEAPAANVYLVLNKPAGVVTTMHDPQGRATVSGLLPDTAGLFPVGRLDLDTTGVLLVTTDGELSHRLLHPSRHVPKVYRVKVKGTMTEEAVERLRRGVELDDGVTLPADVTIVEQDDRYSVLSLTIREGRKRQVKRMCAEVGHPVRRLHRESFGPIDAEGLAEGDIRSLTEEELADLRESAAVEG